MTAEPPAGDGTPSRSISDHFRNIMLGLAGGVSAVVIPILGFHYTSSDKEKEVSKDFVEISTKILSDKPTDQNRPLRQWAISVLDKYSPVPLSDSTKRLLLDSQAIYATTPGGVSRSRLEGIERQGEVLGVSLYRGSRPPDFLELKKHDIQFAYIKATEGISFKDAKEEEFSKQAQNAGLKIGFYHFFVPDEDVDAQLANFEAVLRAGSWDLPPMIDAERKEGHPVPADYAARVGRFAVKIEQEFGVKPVIYTGSSFANDSLDQSIAKYPLFIASFTAESRGQPVMPKWWTDYLFWHMASNVVDDPVLHSYDIIGFKGSAAQLAALSPKRN